MQALSLWIVRQKFLMLLVAVVITALAAFGFARGSGEWASIPPAQGKAAESLRHIEENFRTSHTDCLLVLDVREGDFFTPERMRRLRTIADAVEALPEVRSVVRLTDVVVLMGGRIPIPLIPPNDAEPESFLQARTRALEHPLVRGQLLSPGGETVLVPVQLPDEETWSRKRMLEKIQATARGVGGDGIRIRMTGGEVLNQAVRDAMNHDQRKFLIIGYVLSFGMGVFIFRGFIAACAVGFPSLISVFWALGLLRLMGETINSLTTVVMPLMLTMIAFTHCVHLILHFRRERHRGKNQEDSIQSALRHLTIPCALASLTTAVGFASLMVTESEFIRGFGKACTVGVITAFLAVMILLPLLAGTRLGRLWEGGEDGNLMERFRVFFTVWIEFVLRNPRTLVWLAVIASVVFGAMALTLRSDNRVATKLPVASEAYQTLAHCDEVFGGIQQIQVLIGWSPNQTEAEVISLLNGVNELIVREPDIHHSMSLNHLLAALPGQGTLESRMSWLDQLPTSLVAGYYRREQRETLVRARVQDLGIAHYQEAFKRIEEGLRELESRHPGFQLILTGEPVVWGRYLDRMVMDLAQSVSLAAVIILIIVGWVFRSVRIGLIAMIPNLFPLGFTAALLVLAGQTLELASVCAFTICLGIATDDTIHFLSRYLRERRDNRGASIDAVLRTTFFEVGNALILTTVVMVAGMAVILFSAIPSYRYFGLMACGTLVAALIADLLFLPALLKQFEGKRMEFRGEEDASA